MSKQLSAELKQIVMAAPEASGLVYRADAKTNALRSGKPKSKTQKPARL